MYAVTNVKSTYGWQVASAALVPANGLSRARAQALLTGRGNRRAVQGVSPVYRRMSGSASCRSGASVAEIGVNEASYTGQSQLWKLHLCNRGSRDGPKPGIRAGQPLSLRPRPQLAAWVQSRTGTPAAPSFGPTWRIAASIAGFGHTQGILGPWPAPRALRVLSSCW